MKIKEKFNRRVKKEKIGMDYIIDEIKEVVFNDEDLMLKGVTTEGEEILIKMPIEQAFKLLKNNERDV